MTPTPTHAKARSQGPCIDAATNGTPMNASGAIGTRMVPIVDEFAGLF